MSERKLTEEAREIAHQIRAAPGVSGPGQWTRNERILAAALEAALAREQRKDEAVATILSGSLFRVRAAAFAPEIGVRYSEPIRSAIAGELRQLEDLARQALAAVPVETQEATASDDYARPGWRMFPLF